MLAKSEGLMKCLSILKKPIGLWKKNLKLNFKTYCTPNMTPTKITVQTLITADLPKVWSFYTGPEHITQWNFAHPSWCCPAATNDLCVGGKYFARMEAKDGSFGFDFEAIYLDVQDLEQFTYEFGGRQATVEFKKKDELVEVTVTFDPEQENSLELQRDGWQAILDSFKNYVESN